MSGDIVRHEVALANDDDDATLCIVLSFCVSGPSAAVMSTFWLFWMLPGLVLVETWPLVWAVTGASDGLMSTPNPAALPCVAWFPRMVSLLLLPNVPLALLVLL
jgi:hypothetical protein